MKKATAIAKLRTHARALRRMGATSLYLFGSTARNAARKGSDVDVFIDYDPKSDFSLIELIGIKLYLEDELQTPVDVTTREGLHRLIRKTVEETAVRIY
jgi:uncharacterized protein